MNWRRVIAFVLWTAVMTLAFLAIAFVALIGDCPEHVISGWQGGTACGDQKRVIARSLVIAFPLLWLLGTIGIFRRWSR